MNDSSRITPNKKEDTQSIASLFLRLFRKQSKIEIVNATEDQNRSSTLENDSNYFDLEKKNSNITVIINSDRTNKTLNSSMKNQIITDDEEANSYKVLSKSFDINCLISE